MNLPEEDYYLILQLKLLTLKVFKKILKWFFLSLLFLILAVYIFIQTPFGQNWIGRQVTKKLSKELQTKISIKHVDFALLNRMNLEGVLIEDQHGDTLVYAGKIQVKITDWFVFKKEAELKYIGLENTIVKFHRTDSVWNQQFLFDYFSSSPSSGKKKKAGIRFNLKQVIFKNVSFSKKDEWLGYDLSARIGLLYLDAKDVNLSGNQFDINSLFVKDPVIALKNYTGLKPKTNAANGNDDETSASSWNDAKTIFKIARLKVANGTFSTDKETERAPFSYFDGQHLLVKNINCEINSSILIGDTVYAKLNLSAKEKSGFELKQLTANLKMTPQLMAFSEMELKTNRSTISNSFSMSYNNMGDLGDFIHKVRMEANFNDTHIESDDIAFFAPALSSWKKTIDIQGKVRGTVNELVGRGLIINAGNNTTLNGDITLTGLPNINQTFIDFKANHFKTTYGDAVTIVPALRRINTPNLKKIQYVNFIGSFTGFIHDFVTFGTIQTNLGTIKSDLNMKLPVGKEPAYSGSIATQNFNLGEFLGNKNIGLISMKGTLKGRGFKENTRNTLLDGTISFAEYNGYRYNNILVKGNLDKKLFEGEASIRDENVGVDLNGIIDFNATTPRFNLMANVSKANLRKLNLVKDSLEISGQFNFDFTSSSIDDFLGTARVSGAEIKKDGRRLPFDSLVIHSTLTDNGKVLTVASNEFGATFTGNFNLGDIPNGFAYLLNNYYPAYVKKPHKTPKKQQFHFDITTQYADDYLRLVDTSFSGLNFSHFSGNVNLDKNELNLVAEVPQFKYKKYNFDNVNITATGTAANLQVNGEAYNILINDSLNIPRVAFTISADNDSSRVGIISGANRNVDTANLNALILTYNDGVKIEIDPSTFTINGKLWTIDENGELEFRSKHPASGQLVLRSGEQNVTLKTVPSVAGGDWNDLKVQLTNLNVGDFSPFFLPKNRLEGLLSGHILVEDPTNNLKITSDDIQTKFLRLDNDSLGEVKATIAYDNASKELKAKGNTLNEENHLDFDAHLFFDPLKAKENNIALKAKKYYLSVLERFLGDLFSDINGYLTGDINITGEFNNLAVTGKGKLEDAGLKVNFTQCYYKIKNTDIELTPQLINLDGIILTDTITHNPIYISGGIEHQSFKNMFYNLDIATRKPRTTDEGNNRPVQLINTTYKDNQQFYGNVKGTGSLSLLGPQANMYMKIDAIASEKDSSFVTIPPISSRESGIADFLVERKFGREMTETEIRNNESSIVYDVDVTANPMVNVRVVLDELTGDEIKGKGSGTLNIRSGTTEPLSLRGRFDIKEGSYLFTFQSFFKKPFTLRENASNYIEWNGDPDNANIQFEASYKAERVSFAPLGTSFNLSSGISNARGDVYVIANLTGNLFKPDIKFSLDFPNTSVAVTDPELALLIHQMQKNTNELNKQVTYLIVLNSFAPSELGINDFDAEKSGLNTISSIFLNVLSEQINKILGKLVKNDKYNINLNTSFYNRNVIDKNKSTALNLSSNINFSIGRSFFNNRFIISTGVGLDAPLQQSTIEQSIILLPDVTLEWLINPSGTLRVSLFYRENTDYLAAADQSKNAKRAGVSLSYKRDFDRLSDIFNKHKKKEKQPVPVEDPSAAKKEESPEEQN